MKATDTWGTPLNDGDQAGEGGGGGSNIILSGNE